ncbi:MAG: alpha/beta hydrolase [Gemmatimonadales bacterium]|nr:MAG: alpha/beta hydrolase [Gemmatimonadales bacterium]
MDPPVSLQGVPLRERRIPVQGITLRVVEAGPEEGPLVVLLHGFPEFWYGWRKQIPALARAGYRVWVPDQRGYGGSDKPRGVAAYRVETLALDVVGLIRAAGVERAAAVVGHDWGAAVAWWVGIAHPERLERLVILNVPHPSRGVMRAVLRKRPGQLLMSWYVFAFQLPVLPEWLMRRQNWRILAANLRGRTSESITREDRDRYREAWSVPGAITGMVNWYRAMLRHPPRAPGRARGSTRVGIPTLILWGERDRYLTKELAPLSLERCDRGRLITFPEATHWLQHDEPEGVNQALLEFLGDARSNPTTGGKS